MKRLTWAVAALVGFVVVADDFNAALDCDGLTFTTGGDASWFVQSDGGKVGESALCSGEIDDEQATWVETTATEVGMLSFWWKVSSEPGCDKLSVSVNGGRQAEISGTGGDWQRKELFVKAGETVRWTYSKDGGSIDGADCGWLDGVEWTPAPERITVTFNANGGSVAEETREYGAGETYDRDGDEVLPTPTRTGWTFLGWRVDSVNGAAASGADMAGWVPAESALRESVVLVAKWGQPVTAAFFNTKTLSTVKLSGADKWFMVDDSDLGTVAEVEAKGKTIDEGECTLSLSSMQVTSSAGGYLTFHWSLTNGGRPKSVSLDYPFADITFYVDGKAVKGLSVWDFGQSTGDQQVYVYIPAGKHTLKWTVEGRPAFAGGYWDMVDDEEVWVDMEFGSLPVARVWGVALEPLGSQPDFQTWGDKVKKYKSWRTGDLAKFAAQFKARMIADPNDYEARVLFAATQLGALAENKQFTDYAKTFGFTVDWARLSVTPPTPKFDKKSAPVNSMVDRTLVLATPAIREAQDALAGIPEDWSGSVTLDKESWPLDDTVCIDAADVLFARAGLDAALAGLNFLGAYDLTVNWPKVNDTVKLVTKIPVVKALPSIGDGAAWEKNARNVRTVVDGDTVDGETRGSASLAVSGTKLALRLSYPYVDGWLNESNQVHMINFWIRSGTTKLNLSVGVHGENGMWEHSRGSCGPAYITNGHPYGTATNAMCWVTDRSTDGEWKAPATIAIRGNELVLTVDMKSVNLGTKKKPVGFTKKSWTVDVGEVGVGVWSEVENPEWFEPYEVGDELIEPDEDVPQFISKWTENGRIEWEGGRDIHERRAAKFIDDQTALFSKVRDASRLSASRRQFKAALERALVADGKALLRDPEDPMHFFEYDPEFKPMIDCARANTHRALEALEAPTVVDFKKVAEDWDAMGIGTNKLRLAEFKYTLLPNEGMTRIYLGALFEGKITRDLLPPMRLNAYGEIVPDFDAMPDPTIGGLIPDMTYDIIKGHDDVQALTERFETARELDHGEPTDVESLPKPGEKLDFASYTGYDVSGLPKGWTWNKKTGVLTPTTSGSFTLTFKKGKTTKQEVVQVGPKPAVLLFSDDETAVAVTGTGLYNVGATVKVVAAVKNGFAFGGWYGEDGELVSPLAAYSFKMTRGDVSLLATTIPLEDDGLYAKPAEGYALDLAVDCGDLTPFQVKSASPFSVSVSGLPPGLSTSNDTIWVEDEGVFSGDMHVTGTPTKAGVYYTTFAAKNNGGFTWTAVVKFVVGDAEENEVNTAGINWDKYADGEGEVENDWANMRTGVRFGAFLDVPNSSAGSAPVSVTATKTVKKKATNTLPPGLSASFKNGRIAIAGIPSTPGKFTMEFTVAYKNKKSAKAVKTVVVKDSGSVYIPTGVIDNDPNGTVRGTAVGGGVKQFGQTVKFVATPANKKKLFFAGWYVSADATMPSSDVLTSADYKSATLSAQLPNELCWSWAGHGMYARFVTKEEESADGVMIICDDMWRVCDEENAATEFNVYVSSDTKPTLSAKGLPAGTKLSGMKLVVSKPAALVPGWYAVTLTAKTAAGNTAKKTVDVLVPNVTAAIDAGVLSGLDTSDGGYTNEVMQAGVKQTFTLGDLGVTVSNGWTLAVTGLPKGWTYNAKTGEFSGIATKVGKTTVTFTVSQKVGRKTTSYKATATFDLAALPSWATGTFVGMAAENAYVRMDVAANGTVSGYRFDAAGKKTFTATGFTMDEEGFLSTTLKGKGVSLAVRVYPFDNLGVQQGMAEFNEGAASNSPWGVEGAEPLPVFADAASLDVAVGSGKLALKFGAKGAVTCTYTVGKNATSGSTQICMLEWSPDDKAWFAQVPVALAAKKDKKGKVLVPALVGSFPLKFAADDEGNVVSVDVIDQD